MCFKYFGETIQLNDSEKSANRARGNKMEIATLQGNGGNIGLERL